MLVLRSRGWLPSSRELRDSGTRPGAVDRVTRRAPKSQCAKSIPRPLREGHVGEAVVLHEPSRVLRQPPLAAVPGSSWQKHSVRHFFVVDQATEQWSLPSALGALPRRVERDPEFSVIVPSDCVPSVSGSSRRRTQPDLPDEGTLGRKDIDAPIAQVQHGQQSVIGEVHADHGPNLSRSLPPASDGPDECAVPIEKSKVSTIGDEDTAIRADGKHRRPANQVLWRTLHHADSRYFTKGRRTSQGRGREYERGVSQSARRAQR